VGIGGDVALRFEDAGADEPILASLAVDLGESSFIIFKEFHIRICGGA
jgi:hypothetical protein